MAGELNRDTLFVALTRPQMFAGVTYSFFVINAVLAVELFLIFKSFWVLFASAIIHLIGMLASHQAGNSLVEIASLDAPVAAGEATS